MFLTKKGAVHVAFVLLFLAVPFEIIVLLGNLSKVDFDRKPFVETEIPVVLAVIASSLGGSLLLRHYHGKLPDRVKPTLPYVADKGRASFWKHPGVILLSALGFLPTLGSIVVALNGNLVGMSAQGQEQCKDTTVKCYGGALGLGIFASLFWGLVFAHWKWPQAMNRAWEDAGSAG